MNDSAVPERPQQPPAVPPTSAYPTAVLPTGSAAAPPSTAVIDEPRNHGIAEGGFRPADPESAAIHVWNPAPPGLLGTANIIVSSLVAVFWLWIPLALFFMGIGGLFALGSGLICLFIWLFLQRGINYVERLRAEAVYSDAIRIPRPDRSAKDGVAGFFENQWLIVKSSVFWRSTAHHCVKALYGAFACGLALIGFAAGSSLLAGAINPVGADFHLFGPLDGVGVRLLNGMLGVVFMLVGLAILWFAPYLDRALDRGLLPATRTTALRAEVDTLDRARAGAVDAATAERLRIERDLHDGVQPMLVALSMKLGMAKSKLDSDPVGAQQLLNEAHGESKAAITELRQLARGIHPAVLTDRGLDPAISALAARSVVPVDVVIDLPQRPGTEAESVAYFVVAEALTNIHKHSGATRARVSIIGSGDTMQVSVSDNGTGGAQVCRDGSHTGLSGLVDRVTAARGTWTLTSPIGGPTTLVVEVPCAS
jgi:signal transduction histidine kinase